MDILIKKFEPAYFKYRYYNGFDLYVSAIIIKNLVLNDYYGNKEFLGCSLLFYGTSRFVPIENSFLFDTFYASIDEAYNDLFEEFEVIKDNFISISECDRKQYKYLKND